MARHPGDDPVDWLKRAVPESGIGDWRRTDATFPAPGYHSIGSDVLGLREAVDLVEALFPWLPDEARRGLVDVLWDKYFAHVAGPLTDPVADVPLELDRLRVRQVITVFEYKAGRLTRDEFWEAWRAFDPEAVPADADDPHEVWALGVELHGCRCSSCLTDPETQAIAPYLTGCFDDRAARSYFRHQNEDLRHHAAYNGVDVPDDVGDVYVWLATNYPTAEIDGLCDIPLFLEAPPKRTICQTLGVHELPGFQALYENLACEYPFLRGHHLRDLAVALWADQYASASPSYQSMFTLFEQRNELQWRAERARLLRHERAARIAARGRVCARAVATVPRVARHRFAARRAAGIRSGQDPGDDDPHDQSAVAELARGRA